jgi:hypothetical protein
MYSLFVGHLESFSIEIYFCINLHVVDKQLIYAHKNYTVL